MTQHIKWELMWFSDVWNSCINSAHKESTSMSLFCLNIQLYTCFICSLMRSFPSDTHRRGRQRPLWSIYKSWNLIKSNAAVCVQCMPNFSVIPIDWQSRCNVTEDTAIFYQWGFIFQIIKLFHGVLRDVLSIYQIGATVEVYWTGKPDNITSVCEANCSVFVLLFV